MLIWMLSYPHSFGMAYEFIDSIGDDVDVVSDSEVGNMRKKNYIKHNSFIRMALFENKPNCFAPFPNSEHQEAAEDSLQ